MATCFGLGLSPLAPGTAGALVGVAIFAATRLWAPPEWTTPILLLSLLAFCWLNHLLTPYAVRRWKNGDPSQFVLDEVAGYLMTVLLFRGGPDLAATLLLTFVLTRLMDVLKIPPARQFERLPGSWGIVLDDLMSSLYAVGLLWLLRWYFPSLFA
ncbi:MAG TPA: phosphatidylglycerophosphatase A [Acidobacteriota bacterium]|nr:phosphatidylglycerophosphatase A [Acidobacteriota bacterium]